MLDFVRFPTPHTGEATAIILYESLGKYDLRVMIQSVTMDNAADMLQAMTRLKTMINAENPTNKSVYDICVCSIAHIVNMAVKERLTDVHTNIHQIRKLISAVRSSVKRRDLYEKTKIQMGLTIPLPCLAVRTRWSSTYKMVHGETMAKEVLNSITIIAKERRSFAIEEVGKGHPLFALSWRLRHQSLNVNRDQPMNGSV